MIIVHDAMAVARELHGQKYFKEHLSVVADIMHLTDSYTNRGDRDEMLAAAYLHDVLEDTDFGGSKLLEMFGAKVFTWVDAVTDNNNLRNRKLKKLEVYNRTRKHNVAVCLKMADRLANIRRCHANERQDKLQMYQKEHYTFAAALFDWRNKSLWIEMEQLLGASLLTEIYEDSQRSGSRSHLRPSSPRSF